MSQHPSTLSIALCEERHQASCDVLHRRAPFAMKRSSWRVAILLSAVHLLTAVSSARADEWSVTPFLGGAFEERRRSGVGDSMIGVGFAGGYAWSESANIEAELTYIPDLSRNRGGVSSGRLSIINISGVFLYDLRSTGWQPFLAAGVGYGRRRSTQRDVGFPPNPPLRGPSISLGGGLKIPLTRRAVFRSELRYVAIRDLPDDITDLWRFSGGLTIALSR